jgi:hypothetical protein
MTDWVFYKECVTPVVITLPSDISVYNVARGVPRVHIVPIDDTMLLSCVHIHLSCILNLSIYFMRERGKKTRGEAVDNEVKSYLQGSKN